MPSNANILIFFAFILAITFIGFILFRAFSSHLRPLFIVGVAWKTAASSPRDNFKTVMMVVAVIALGRALQRIVTYYPFLNETMLLALSIIWQAVLNMSLAMIAVTIHLHTIEYVKSRFGLYDYELKISHTDKLLASSLYGGAIWAFGWITLVGARYFLHASETQYPTVIANLLTFILYIQASLLMLIRPAYSLELNSPWRSGIIAAIKSAPTLLVVQACLSVPIILYNILFAHISGLTSHSSAITLLIYDTIFVAFSAVQFLAVEASASLLLARLELSRLVFKKSYG